jgi:hypothetical protein
MIELKNENYSGSYRCKLFWKINLDTDVLVQVNNSHSQEDVREEMLKNIEREKV